jgi:hypothetical protein
VVVVPSPQPGCPRSLFGRLGIRKPSLLSLTSPHGHNNHQTSASATSRTFSLDDLLKPPPRSKISLRPPVIVFKKTESEGHWLPLHSCWITVAMSECCWSWVLYILKLFDPLHHALSLLTMPLSHSRTGDKNHTGIGQH